jgi:hypothetical protein
MSCIFREQIDCEYLDRVGLELRKTEIVRLKYRLGH